MRINANTSHPGQIDDQTSVADCQPRSVVSAPANGKKQVVLPSVVDGADNVSHIETTNNEAGFSVDHTIVNFASGVISCVLRLDKFAA